MTDINRLCAKILDGSAVGLEITLKSENANPD